MFDRIAYGWELTKESARVLRLDKELLVFPLLSGVSCLLVLAGFGLPLWNSEYASVIFNEGALQDELAKDPLAYVIAFAFFAVNYFVIVFFNSALVSCAIIRFKGGDPTVADGFRIAFSRLPVILAWSLVSATVGFVLRIIESRSERAGQIAAALLGAGWTIATYFVVPVLVVEQVGPIQAVKRSLSVLSRTWGEAVTAGFSKGFFVFLATLVAIIPLVAGMFAIGAGLIAVGAALIACGVVALLVVSQVSTALDSILLAALYLYAAEGGVPRHFDDGLLEHAFGHR
jgi:hypothetical protein